MTITKDQIIGALPKLSQQDLLAIKAVTGTLLDQGATNPTNGHEGPQAWLFGAMQGVVGIKYGPPCKHFNKNAPCFLDFINSNFGDLRGRKVQTTQIMTALLRLLADDLKARKLPVTVGVMSGHLPRIAEVFDNSFPGYRVAGLSGLFLVGH